MLTANTRLLSASMHWMRKCYNLLYFLFPLHHTHYILTFLHLNSTLSPLIKLAIFNMLQYQMAAMNLMMKVS